MIHLVHCDGYRVVASLPHCFPVGVLPAVCRAWEHSLGGTFAVVASREGHFIADAEEVFEKESSSRAPQAEE